MKARSASLFLLRCLDQKTHPLKMPMVTLDAVARAIAHVREHAVRIGARDVVVVHGECSFEYTIYNEEEFVSSFRVHEVRHAIEKCQASQFLCCWPTGDQTWETMCLPRAELTR